jgi:assimilatory nitrate reductase catalytic subunit
VRLTSARGTLVATAALSDGIRPDTVFLPFHWAGDLSANLLTNDATDPVSGMPEFKVCAVQVERASAPARVEVPA